MSGVFLMNLKENKKISNNGIRINSSSS